MTVYAAVQEDAVLAPPAKAAIFLVCTVRPGREDEVRDALSGLAGLTRGIGYRAPEDRLSCVVGVGAEVWPRLFGAPAPSDLHPFAEIAGPTHTAVSTPGDLLFHLRADRLDLCFELATEICSLLTSAIDVTEEVQGFRYFDERDLLGFVDGTENPLGAEAVDVVRVSGDGSFADGSYVLVQKYLHDVAAWNQLTVEQQEQAIGRHKLSDREFADDDKASNSHLALNTIEDADGRQLKIVRDNMPFGSAGRGEFGTYFIGYAADPGVIEQMLRNMFLGKPAGNHDRVLDFSTAVTGGLFYCPPAAFLDDPPEPAQG